MVRCQNANQGPPLFARSQTGVRIQVKARSQNRFENSPNGPCTTGYHAADSKTVPYTLATHRPPGGGGPPRASSMPVGAWVWPNFDGEAGMYWWQPGTSLQCRSLEFDLAGRSEPLLAMGPAREVDP